jgi:hypothetical protein
MAHRTGFWTRQSVAILLLLASGFTSFAANWQATLTKIRPEISRSFGLFVQPIDLAGLDLRLRPEMSIYKII